MYQLLLFLTLLAYSSSSYPPGPRFIATKGEVWPKPVQQEKTADYYIIKPHAFTFKAPDNIGCPNFLNDAFTRYWTIIAMTASRYNEGVWERFESTGKEPRNDGNFLGYLESLEVVIKEECAGEDILPSLEDAEDYSVTVDANGATVSATSIWGVLRGLESFSQLIYLEQDSLVINATSITDYPRFPHRGLLIDTSRHFEPLSILYQMLDAMVYNKFNVFHWHLTDDESFPYKSRTFPELSDAGAYHPTAAVYQQSDIQKVIEYARVRGIRVIPEIDTPGHTRSWGVSHPELLATCYEDGKPRGDLGPLDPSQNATYEFVNQLFTEVVDVFPDKYFHIGGDEVEFECWNGNPQIGQFMTKNNLTTFEELESYYIQNVVNHLNSLNAQYLVWEEVFTNGVELPDSTVVHVWKNNGLSKLLEVVKAGKKGLYSSCWYLSVLSSGSNWDVFYKCEPLMIIHGEQRNLVLGGEACMWGEYVNEHNIIQRVWPRASAVAERLWSEESVKDVNAAKPRLEEHSCRMNKRGIASQPANGPGVCL